MSEIRPLQYVNPVGGTLSGGILTAVTSSGDYGIWREPQTLATLDPAITYTLGDLIDAYNTAVWGLYKSGAVLTDPLVGFNEISYGMDIKVNSGSALEYRYGSNTCKANTIVDALNTLLAGTSVVFFYSRRRGVELSVPSGTSLEFVDPPGAIQGTALRFLRKLLGSSLPATVVGPTVLRGPVLDSPFIGVYPAPAGVSNLRATGVTASSVTISWDASPTPGVQYLVIRQGSATTYFTTGTTWTFSGLAPNTSYSFRVRTLTDNAISTDVTSINVKTLVSVPAFGPPASGKPAQFNPWRVDGQLSLINNTVGFRVPNGSSYIGYSFNNIIFGPINGTTGALQPVSGQTISNGDVKAYIYSVNPTLATGSNPISPAMSADIQTTSNPLVYTFTFSSTITITVDMYILFVCTNTSKSVNFYYYFPLDTTLAGVGGVIRSSTGLNNVVDKYFGVLCTFNPI
jgi:hypothetical protein